MSVPQARPDVRSAVGNLIDDADVQALFAEDPEEPEAVAPPAPEEPDPSSGPDGAPHVEPPAAPAAPAEDDSVVTAEPADEYWGVDLRGIPPEKQAEIIARFKQQDETIRRTQREKAEAARQAQPEPTVVEPPAVQTDDDFLASQGFGPDNPYHDIAKELLLPVLKPMVQQLQESRQQVNALVEDREAEKYAAHWNSELDELESKYGTLPVSRQDLLDQAIADGVFDPTDAYARAMLPARQLNAEAAKAREEAMQLLQEKKRSAGAAPRRGDAAKAANKLEASDVRSAIREAMPKVAEDIEFDWSALGSE